MPQTDPIVTFAQGEWKEGNIRGSIVTDAPFAGEFSGYDDIEHYGGYLIAESVATCNQSILQAAPDLYWTLDALEWQGEGGCCLECFGTEDEGHAHDCGFGNTLAKARGEQR